MTRADPDKNTDRDDLADLNKEPGGSVGSGGSTGSGGSAGSAGEFPTHGSAADVLQFRHKIWL